MRTMTIVYGIFLAAVFAVATPVALVMLQCVFPPWIAFRIAVSAAVVAYTVLILPRSTRKSGRTFTLAVVAVLQGTLFVAIAPFWAFVLGSAGVVWIARSLLLSRSILHIFTEACLMSGALFCALFAAKATGSLAVAIWSMLLVLSAGSLIGRPFEKRGVAWRPERTPEPRFERAFHTAEQAIAALSRE